MNVSTTNNDPRPEDRSQPVTRETGAHLSSVLLNRASLAAARQSDRLWCETLLWLLLGAGCVLWPLTQTYQQTSAFVDGRGLARLAVHAICKGTEAPQSAPADASTVTCRGQATICSTDEAARPEQTATIPSSGHLFSALAQGAGALAGTSLH